MRLYAAGLIFLVTFISSGVLNAQGSNWKKDLKTANELYAVGKYAEAADYYLSVYQKNGKSINYLANAAQSYQKARLYQQAAKYYNQLQGSPQHPLATYHYAKALKQSGQCEDAIPYFKRFLINYTGSDVKKYIALIKNEIAGCELAIAGSNTTDLTLERLNEEVNTDRNEYAPLPFNDAILYFSSDANQYSKIYRSQYHGGQWTKAVLPTFPKFKDVHVGHGTFTPDNKRFYFTVCQGEVLDPVQSSCDIYVTVLESGNWSTPKKLRDYIKLEGTTATQPYVLHDGKMEILYFASDRKGGYGGMDIWYMTRHVDSPEYDFTLPKNAGPTINTPGDEVSPYYDAYVSTLYFSSDGLAGLGGFDIFAASGAKDEFTKAENLRAPVNSPADDYYYIKNTSRIGAFMVSNRAHGSEKTSTVHNDIFFISSPEERLLVEGNIYDKNNNSILSNAQVLLYEVIDNTQKKRLLQSIVASNGTYQFVLMPDRQYQIEVLKEGYVTTPTTFDTHNFNYDQPIGRPIYMDSATEQTIAVKTNDAFETDNSTASIDKILNSQPEKKEPTPFDAEREVSNSFNTNSGAKYVNSYYNGMEVTTSAPKLTGVYYKVQISTAGSFNPTDDQFSVLRNQGEFQTEKIREKNWTRILLAEYYSLAKARRIMDFARANGFPESFVVKYRDGKRLN